MKISEMKITIKRKVPLLNEMLRQHWSKRKKLKEQYHLEILSQKPQKFKGRVNVCLTRYSSSVPDPDGVAGSAKMILDAVVDAGIIEDDNMNVINNFSVSWRKCRRAEQRTEIEITDT